MVVRFEVPGAGRTRRRRGSVRLCRWLLMPGVVVWLAGCSPAVDWREMQMLDLPLRMSMPCRPASHQREVNVAGQLRPMTMVACAKDGGTFAVAHVALADPLQAGVVLHHLAESSQANVRGPLIPVGPAKVPGMTPQPLARQWRIDGKLPDGRSVVLHGLVFSYGPQVFQASVIGERPDEDLVRTFFSALAVRP